MKKYAFLMLSLFLSPLHAESLQSLAPILKQTMPAIVNISAQGELPAGMMDEEEANDERRKSPSTPFAPNKPRKFQSMGSGVILDPQHGIIVTNDHVIRHANLITITSNA
jgi:serine protease Do